MVTRVAGKWPELHWGLEASVSVTVRGRQEKKKSSGHIRDPGGQGPHTGSVTGRAVGKLDR